MAESTAIIVHWMYGLSGAHNELIIWDAVVLLCSSFWLITSIYSLLNKASGVVVIRTTYLVLSVLSLCGIVSYIITSPGHPFNILVIIAVFLGVQSVVFVVSLDYNKDAQR